MRPFIHTARWSDPQQYILALPVSPSKFSVAMMKSICAFVLSLGMTPHAAVLLLLFQVRYFLEAQRPPKVLIALSPSLRIQSAS